MFRLINLLNTFTMHLGRAIRWLTLIMVVLVCAVVFMRYFLGSPSIILQESVLYLHATVFMAGMAYTWQQGGHVRVDVFTRNWSQQRKNRIEQLGIIFFVVPVCIFILIMSWKYVGNSWAISERSEETGGLPLVYLLKSLIIVMPCLLLLQALVEFGKTLMPTSKQADQLEVPHG